MKNKKLSFINGLIFMILGLIIFFKPDIVVKFISYFVGGLLIAVGLYKIVNYYIHDKNLGVVNNNEMAFGITAVILGLLFIFLAGTIELLLRFIVGGWLVIAGISRISNTFYTTIRDSKFFALIIVGLILIGAGIYVILVSNLALSIIGLFMAVYGLIDFVSYFVYKNSFINNNDEVKELVVEEAEIVEEKDDVSHESNNQKNKKNTKKKK